MKTNQKNCRLVQTERLFIKKKTKFEYSPIFPNLRFLLTEKQYNSISDRIMPKIPRSSLCSQNVSFLVKVEGTSIREIGKKSRSAKKNDLFEKQNSDIACWATE